MAKLKEKHSHKTLHLVVGAIFGLIALAHLWRVIAGMNVTFGNTPIPMWPSWIAIIISGILAYLSLKHAK